VQEEMHSIHQCKEKGMLIKLDMENSFDRVKLSFLYKVLLSFGFNSEFVNLIKVCTEKPWIAPLVNGKPTKFSPSLEGSKARFPPLPLLVHLNGRFTKHKANC
jgi:hypothetical protein